MKIFFEGKGQREGKRNSVETQRFVRTLSKALGEKRGHRTRPEKTPVDITWGWREREVVH